MFRTKFLGTLVAVLVAASCDSSSSKGDGNSGSGGADTEGPAGETEPRAESSGSATAAPADDTAAPGTTAASGTFGDESESGDPECTEATVATDCRESEVCVNGNCIPDLGPDLSDYGSCLMSCGGGEDRISIELSGEVYCFCSPRCGGGVDCPGVSAEVTGRPQCVLGGPMDPEPTHCAVMCPSGNPAECQPGALCVDGLCVHTTSIGEYSYPACMAGACAVGEVAVNLPMAGCYCSPNCGDAGLCPDPTGADGTAQCIITAGGAADPIGCGIFCDPTAMMDCPEGHICNTAIDGLEEGTGLCTPPPA